MRHAAVLNFMHWKTETAGSWLFSCHLHMFIDNGCRGYSCHDDEQRVISWRRFPAYRKRSFWDFLDFNGRKTSYEYYSTWPIYTRTLERKWEGWEDAGRAPCIVCCTLKREVLSVGVFCYYRSCGWTLKEHYYTTAAHNVHMKQSQWLHLYAF